MQLGKSANHQTNDIKYFLISYIFIFRKKENQAIKNTNYNNINNYMRTEKLLHSWRSKFSHKIKNKSEQKEKKKPNKKQANMTH